MENVFQRVEKLDNVLTSIAPQADINKLYDGQLSELTTIHQDGKTFQGKIKVDLFADKPKLDIYNVLDKPLEKDLTADKYSYLPDQKVFAKLDPETNQAVHFSAGALNLPTEIGNNKLSPYHQLDLINEGKLENFQFEAFGKTYTSDLSFQNGVLSYADAKRVSMEVDKILDIDIQPEVKSEKEGIKTDQKQEQKVTGDRALIEKAVKEKDFKKLRTLSGKSFENKALATSLVLNNKEFTNKDRLMGLSSCGHKPGEASKMISEKSGKLDQNIQKANKALGNTMKKGVSTATGMFNNM